MNRRSSESDLSTKYYLFLLVILVIAILLRLWGIGFGLPYEYHVDEPQYVRQAAAMGSKGLEPDWWNNPPLFKYILLFEYGGFFLVGKVIGLFASSSDFGSQLSLNPTPLYLIGRATSAIFGVLTVFLVWRLGTTSYNKRVGLISAWLLAVCFLHVRDSHYAVNDIAFTFFVTFVIWSSVRILQTGEMKWYVLAGVSLGLGFAIKYSAAFAVIPIIVAHFITPHFRVKGKFLRDLKRLGLALLVGGLTALLVSPYFIIEPRKVMRDFYEWVYLPGKVGFDEWQIGSGNGYLFYLQSLTWGIGLALLLVICVGVVIAIIRHSPQDIILISLPIVLYVSLGAQQMYFARFILPAIPALLIIGANGLDYIVSKVDVKLSWATPIVILFLLTFIISLEPLISSLRHDYLLSITDTRTIAKMWIESNIKEGSKIATDWTIQSPPISSPEKAQPNSNRNYEVANEWGTGLSSHDISWYQKQGFDYLIASSFIYDIPLRDKENDLKRRSFYEELDRELGIVYEISPNTSDKELSFIFDEIYGPSINLWKRERPGPTLKIYRLNGGN
jgi:4-amino-4-deoxy-L-arabinose transferase-like glycosyltransferase